MSKTVFVELRLQGGPELDRKLRQLPTRVAKKVIRQALRAGIRPIHIDAQVKAPVKTGLLKRSLKIRAIKRNRQGFIGVRLQTQDGLFKGESFYAAFQEFGWRQGPRRLGNERKFIPGKHYMQRAADERKGDAAAIVSRELAAGIVREAKAI